MCNEQFVNFFGNFCKSWGSLDWTLNMVERKCVRVKDEIMVNFSFTSSFCPILIFIPVTEAALVWNKKVAVGTKQRIVNPCHSGRGRRISRRVEGWEYLSIRHCCFFSLKQMESCAFLTWSHLYYVSHCLDQEKMSCTCFLKVRYCVKERFP